MASQTTARSKLVDSKSKKGDGDSNLQGHGQVFAPEERDVYSNERVPKDLRSVGAKSNSEIFAEEKAVALLRSCGVKRRRPGL